MKRFFKDFKIFVFSKMTITLLAFSCLYPIIMLGIYIPSYTYAGNSIDKITVVIVNEDNGAVGADIMAELAATLPTKVRSDMTLDDAMYKLDNNEIELVIHFPSDFSDLVADPSESLPQVNYYTNGIMATVTNGIVNSIVTSIQTQLSDQFGSVTPGIINNSKVINSRGGKIQNQVGSMFVVIASYTCGVLCASIMVQMINKKRAEIGRFRTLLYAELFGLMVAFVAPLGGLAIFAGVSGISFLAVLEVWPVLACVTFCSLQINMTYNLLFKNMGSILGTATMLTQLIASGAMFSRSIMVEPFLHISYAAPLFYAMSAVNRMIYGGTNIGMNIGILLAILAGLLGIVIGVYTLLTREKKPKTKAGVNISENVLSK